MLELVDRKEDFALMDSFAKFKESLLYKNKFCRLLTDNSVSDKGYMHAVKVWRTFKIKNKNEYHNLYLTCEVLLYADLFRWYLWIRSYLSSIGLSLDAILKMTGVTFAIFLSVDMHQPIKRDISGEHCYITERSSEPSMSSLKENHKINEDANNLYRATISKLHSTDGFKLLDVIEQFYFKQI